MATTLSMLKIGASFVHYTLSDTERKEGVKTQFKLK